VNETRFWNYGRESLMEMQEMQFTQNEDEFLMKNKRKKNGALSYECPKPVSLKYIAAFAVLAEV
jgi:hypothetical protein